MLTQTTWGRRVYALGDNPEATRLMGVPVRRQLLMVYVVAGVDLRHRGAAADRPHRTWATRTRA